MTAILGMADSLKDTCLTQDQKTYVATICKAGESLLGLVDDVLDISRIESGKFSVKEEPFSLVELLDTVEMVNRAAIEDKGLIFDYHVDGKLPQGILGDNLRLQQSLSILLSNAIKFTEQGTISFHAKDLSVNSEMCTLHFTIRDTGTGIPDKLRSNLFKCFSQLDESSTRRFGGIGRGLFLVKALADHMGGRLTFSSKVGEGSCFHLTLPARRVENVKSKGRLLVVDDEDDFSKMLAAHYEATGIEVDRVNSAAEAVERLKSCSFDAILSELNMPQVDGFAFLEKLRHLGIKTPFVLVSSGSCEHIRNRIYQEKIFDYIEKPFKFSVLDKILDKAIRIGKFFHHHRLNSEAICPLRILIAEDTPDNRKLLATYLKRYPYTVDFAHDGREALRTFKQRCYDIVLMDVQMPLMDGYETTREIRAFERESGRERTPILILTAHDEQQKGKDAGCDYYITKPIKRSVLIEKIIKFTQGNRHG